MCIILHKGYKMNETIKKTVRDDLYWTIEGTIGSKAEARRLLNLNFDFLFAFYGDTEKLYTKMYKTAGMLIVDNVWQKA